MWLMLQQDQADDFVIATGSAHSVRECLQIAFDQVGVSLDGHVETDPGLLRPAEVEQLIGDAGKAKRMLDWEPEVSFEEIRRASCLRVWGARRAGRATPPGLGGGGGGGSGCGGLRKGQGVSSPGSPR